MAHFASSQQLLHDTLAGRVVRDSQRFVLDVLPQAGGVDFDGGLRYRLVQAGIAGGPRVTAELFAGWFRTSAQRGRARGRRTHRQRVGPAAHWRDLHVFQHLVVALAIRRLRRRCFKSKGYLGAFPVR